MDPNFDAMYFGFTEQFQRLVSKEFIRYLIFDEDLKIVVDATDVGYENKIIWVRSTGKSLQCVLNRCMVGANARDRKFMKDLKFLSDLMKLNDPRILHHPQRQLYVQRFLLDIYFETRQLTIWKVFNDGINHGIFNTVKPDPIVPLDFYLQETGIFWQALNHCFHHEVFIHHLHAEFMSLSRAILNRYEKFVNKIVKKALTAKSENFDELVFDIMIDVDILRSVVGKNAEYELGTGVFQIIKHAGRKNLLQLIDYFDDHLCFTYRHVEVSYVLKKVADAEHLLKSVRLYERIYRYDNEVVWDKANTYVGNIIQKIEDVYEACIERNIPEVLRITDLLVHSIGRKYISEINNLYQLITHLGKEYDSYNLSLQLRLDVQFFIENTRLYVYEPLRNGTYTKLLLAAYGPEDEPPTTFSADLVQDQNYYSRINLFSTKYTKLLLAAYGPEDEPPTVFLVD